MTPPTLPTPKLMTRNESCAALFGSEGHFANHREEEAIQEHMNRQNAMRMAMVTDPAGATHLEKRREALARQQVELEAAEAVIAQKVADYKGMEKDRARLQMDLGNGKYLFECNSEFVAAAPATLGQDLLRGKLPNGGDLTPAGLRGFYADLAGAERHVAEYPAWRDARETALAELESRMIEFAKVNKIATR